MCEVVTEADAVVAIRAGHSMAGRLIFCGKLAEVPSTNETSKKTTSSLCKALGQIMPVHFHILLWPAQSSNQNSIRPYAS